MEINRLKHLISSSHNTNTSVKCRHAMRPDVCMHERVACVEYYSCLTKKQGARDVTATTTASRSTGDNTKSGLSSTLSSSNWPVTVSSPPAADGSRGNYATTIYVVTAFTAAVVTVCGVALASAYCFVCHILPKYRSITRTVDAGRAPTTCNCLSVVVAKAEVFF